jgi:hypothetical protein
MRTLEELAQIGKTGLKKMASVTNGNETHLSLIEKVQRENSFHLGKKKQAAAKKPAAKPKKRAQQPAAPVEPAGEGDWPQDNCKDGQVKNPKTKKCVKKCEDGKVRNETTGRCVNQRGKKSKKSEEAPPQEEPQEVVDHDSSDDDWPQDNCGDGKVKNPKTKNCVKKCDDDKVRNKTTGRCANRKSKSPKAKQAQPEEEKEKRIVLSGMGITKLKEIAKKLKLSKYSHYKNTPEDIAELRRRIEDRQDQLYGQKRDEPVELVPVNVEPEPAPAPVHEEPVEEEPVPVNVEPEPHDEPAPHDDQKYADEEIPSSMRSILCDPLDDNRSCNGDDVCLIDESGKGKCQSKDADPLGFYETMTFNGKNVIGTRESLSLLRDKLKVSQPPPPPIAADEDITGILKELSDAPTNDDVLSDPSIKELIRCLFKR